MNTYDKIGKGYNQTRKPDPYLLNRMRQHLGPAQNGIYLDIGCGTGNYTSELQQNGYNFIGIDPSKKMLEIAMRNNSEVDWRIGTAGNTDLEDTCLNGILATLTLHHWPDLRSGFSEWNRVLKKNKKAVIFTSTPEQMQGYWLNFYFPKMMKDSMIQMPSLEVIEKSMIENGFSLVKKEKYFVSEDLQDQFLYCGKQKPEMYFNENIRQGISSFSSLSNRAEVEAGLNKISDDIKSGKITELINSFDNDLGDYLFVIGMKK